MRGGLSTHTVLNPPRVRCLAPRARTAPVPAVRIRLDDEPAIRPVEIANPLLDDGVHRRPRQPVDVAYLVHQALEPATRVNWAAVPGQLRFEGASAGASRVARE